MYHCEGEECGRWVLAKPGDPIHVTSQGKLCTRCIGKLASATAQVEREVADKPRKSEGKAAAARARWAAMTPEQRRERVEKMRAGRKVA